MQFSATPVRVVLADDHHFFREGLRGMLTADGMTVVGEATDGERALALARELEPDIIVIDLNMPHLGGIDAVGRIHAAVPSVQVMVLSASAEESDVLRVVADGACGYLLKDTRVDELVASIRLAASGHAVLARGVVRALAARVPMIAQSTNSEPDLTPRELEVIRLITEGADNATIGRELSISRHTVKQYVTNIFGKLDVDSRVEAAVHAVRAGLV